MLAIIFIIIIIQGKEVDFIHHWHCKTEFLKKSYSLAGLRNEKHKNAWYKKQKIKIRSQLKKKKRWFLQQGLCNNKLRVVPSWGIACLLINFVKAFLQQTLTTKGSPILEHHSEKQSIGTICWSWKKVKIFESFICLFFNFNIFLKTKLNLNSDCKGWIFNHDWFRGKYKNSHLWGFLKYFLDQAII